MDIFLHNPYIIAGILGSGLILFVILAISDLKTYLLPNIYVGPFALLGIAFHVVTEWKYVDIYMSASGAMAAAGILILFREIANQATGQDAFGMGDIKLLAAGGIWLGLEAIFLALTIGSFIGIAHGYLMNALQPTDKKQSLNKLLIPAGFGFTIGIAVGGVYQFLYNQPTY